MDYKGWNITTFLLGLATVYATVYVAGKAWENSKDEEETL